MKTGFVAIVGRPNVGKSSLLNKILKKKVSIVTDKSQTTRNSIRGIYHDEDTEIVFVDTPGIHKPHQRLGKEMNNMAFSAAHDVEATLLVVDASLEFGEGDQYLLDHLDLNSSKVIVVINKIDKTYISNVNKLLDIYKEKLPNATIIQTVALDGFNVETLLNEIKKYLVEGEPFYPLDVTSDKDEIFFIKETIRETILKELRDEVPHCVAIYMDNIEWEKDPVYIKATINVEKDGQKGIIIGSNGRKIKEIGLKARRKIEKYLNKHVFLELFVKVENNWRDNESSLKTFGYKFEK